MGDAGTSKKSKNKTDNPYQVLVGSTCVQLTGSLEGTGQKGNISLPSPKNAFAPSKFTFNGDSRVETATSTPHGKLRTAFEVDWNTSSDTGPDPVPNLVEGSIAFEGAMVGFSDSLMNFWDGDFKFKAYSPNLSTYLVSNEVSLREDLKLAVSVEAGPPDTRGAASWTIAQSPPYYASRLRYEKDDLTIHLSSAMHQIEISGTPLLPGSGEFKTGWAVSGGAEIPLPALAEDDSLSFQMTYAVNSRVFLGTSADRSVLAAILPGAVQLPSEGWSAVVSLQHNWTDALASNLMISRVSASVEPQGRSADIRMDRAAANLTYQMTDIVTVGAELGVVDARIDSEISTFNASSKAAGTVGFLWARADF